MANKYDIMYPVVLSFSEERPVGRTSALRDGPRRSGRRRQRGNGGFPRSFSVGREPSGLLYNTVLACTLTLLMHSPQVRIPEKVHLEKLEDVNLDLQSQPSATVSTAEAARSVSIRSQSQDGCNLSPSFYA